MRASTQPESEAPRTQRRLDETTHVELDTVAEDRAVEIRPGCEVAADEPQGSSRDSDLPAAVILDAALDCIVLIDPQGYVTEFNKAAERTFGYRREEVLGRSLADVIIPSTVREQYRRDFAHYLSTGETRALGKRVDMRAMRADGSEFPVELAITRIASKGLPSFIGILRDVTDRNQSIADRIWAETQLAGDKQLLEMVAMGRSLRDVLNALCRFVEEAAPGCFCGVYPIEWSGPTFQYGVAPSLPASYIDPIKSLPVRRDIAPCGIAAFEKEQVIVPDIGSDPRWAGSPYQSHVLTHGLRAVWSTPITSREGTVLGTFCVYQRNPANPSPRLQSLIAQVTHIASIAIARSREEEALRELESDLAHMNRVSMMGVLAASLAHEVKQPIAAARNNALAALNFLDGKPPDLREAREALAGIVGDADRAGDIIDRVRAHTRKAPPRKDRFDLNDAVTEVVELAQTAITRHGVSVHVRPAAELSAVLGDRVQLQQVILNLILNAIEAMISAPGPRELLISTEQLETSGVVAVRDSGPGIEPGQLERVFEAFYTTKSNGVGLGLSICRSIIDAHGGKLWIEAATPRGATFRFTVPRASELRSSSHSPHQTREPNEHTVLDAAHQPASAGSTRPPHLARGPRRRHRDRTL